APDDTLRTRRNGSAQLAHGLRSASGLVRHDLVREERAAAGVPDVGELDARHAPRLAAELEPAEVERHLSRDVAAVRNLARDRAGADLSRPQHGAVHLVRELTSRRSEGVGRTDGGECKAASDYEEPHSWS